MEAPTITHDHAADQAVDHAVAKFQAGVCREESFRRIVESYYHPIKGFFARRVFSAEDGLELTQETFLRIYKGLDGFRGEARFRSWAFRIAHTTYLQWLERRHLPAVRAGEIALSERDGEETELPDTVCSDTPLDEVLRKEARQKLGEAVEALPEQERKCMILRVYHDLSHQEVADFLGLQPGTVKAHLHHAREKLRAKLAGSLRGIDF